MQVSTTAGMLSSILHDCNPYSSRVSHLILVDPWGFPERSQQQSHDGQGADVAKRPTAPRWVKAIATVVSFFNPLAVIRAAGPWGKAWAPLLCSQQCSASHWYLTMCRWFRPRLGQPISTWLQKQIWRYVSGWHYDAVHLPLQRTSTEVRLSTLLLILFVNST